MADVPAMLEIYAPHVLTTTNSFEYEVPSVETFTDRVTTYTKQFPWLVWEENGKVLEDYYKANGGDLKVICKSMTGHHPHGLTDPTPIIEFVESRL